MIRALRYSHSHAAQAENYCRARRLGRVAGLVLCGVAGSVQADARIPVPSGQPVELQDVLLDKNPGALWLRFRFMAPAIGKTEERIGYEVAAHDMEFLCNKVVVPYVGKHELDPARIVISLADRNVEFGQSDPMATQFFETYRLENARCIWEEY
ncbi:DUF6497 family protein [Ruegeria sp. 2205SS24-7]|uniref:DUF6497 family protein n=1 Tax=Ruegeria discodermiae TaxID=3064389 RepID=UPI002741C400|nr:DUF6497 family protein [Ruegeria sp. 2205SS24-7]MDP5217900.1 DUF6497 family protein [Ruegeria sp. 2205SS24-7]